MNAASFRLETTLQLKKFI